MSAAQFDKKVENAIMLSGDNNAIKFCDDSIVEESVRGKICEGMCYFHWDNSSIWKRGTTTIVKVLVRWDNIIPLYWCIPLMMKM